MKRFLLIVPTITGCSVLGSLAQGVGFSNPTVEVTGVQVLDVSLTGAELGIYFQANNPNPIGLTLATLEYEVFLNGNSLGSGENQRPVALPKRGASSFSVTYAFSAQELVSAGLSALTSSKHDVMIKANIGIDTPVGVLPFELEYSEELSF